MKTGKRRKKNKKMGAAAAEASRPGAASAKKAGASGLKAWHVVAGGALALVVLFVIYGPALDAPFLFDDKFLPFHNPLFREATIDRWLMGARPTLMLSYWLNYQVSMSDTASYHVVNLLFHFATGILIFFIMRRLLGTAGMDDGRRELLAALGGCVFLFHPLQVEAVAYVASRSENMSVMLFFAAFLVFLYRDEKGIGWVRAAVVLAIFGLAVTTKEHTVMLPLLMVLTDYFWNPGFTFAGVKRNWRLYVPIVLGGTAGMAFVLQTLTESDTAGFGVEGLPWYLYFATQCKVIWIYLRMFILPFGQNVDHAYPMAESMGDPLAILGLVALVGLVAAAWIYRKRFPLGVYGVFTFLLLLAPTSSFVPIKDALVERRLYLPMLGLLLILAEVLRRWRIPSKTLAVGAAAAVVFCAGITMNRAKVWAGPLPLWEDSVAKNPENWRATFQLAYAYYAEQRCTEAAEYYGRTAELGEVDYRLLLDWALAADCAGNPDEALAKLHEAEKLEKTAHLYSQIALIHGRRGQNEEALAALEKAEEVNKYFPLLYFYRGNVLSAMGRWQGAVEAYKMALTLDKNMDAARRGLGRAQQRLGSVN